MPSARARKHTNVFSVEFEYMRCPNCGKPTDRNKAPFTVRNILFGWNCPECECVLHGLYELLVLSDPDAVKRLWDAVFRETHGKLSDAH